MDTTSLDAESPAKTEFPALSTLAFEVRDGGIGILRVNRPQRMNSQTAEMFAEFGIAALALRDLPLRALVLTGAGEKAFCAGYDLERIHEITEMGSLEFLRFIEMCTAGIKGLRELPYPVIAAVHGAATGGGLSLALAADIRLVAPTAKFSAAFVKLGLSVGELGTSYNLTRLVGPGMAAEIAYTGRLVAAEEAVRIGLANRVVDSESLMDEAIAMATAIAQNSPGGVRMSKRAIQRNQEVTSYAAALELENRGQALLTRTEDMAEALAAFKEKRSPQFQNR